MKAKDILRILILINEYIDIERVVISCSDCYDWSIYIDNKEFYDFDRDTTSIEKVLKDLENLLTK